MPIMQSTLLLIVPSPILNFTRSYAPAP
jgi:hypothetical protein